MDDQQYINLYHEISEKAIENVFKRFTEYSKLILTESDLKCWLFLELQKEIEKIDENTLSAYSEVTHYASKEDKNNKRFRDLTLLDSKNLKLNEDIWKNNEANIHALNKGFNHDGPAMHFELKLIRQGTDEKSSGMVDTSDISNLNDVDCTNRAYTIIWVSKNKNFTINNLEEKFKESLQTLNRPCLFKMKLFRIYLFDIEHYKCFKSDDIILLE